MAEWISTSSQSQWSSSSWNYRVTLCPHRFLPVWNNPRYLYPHRLVLVRLTLELIPWKISEHLPVFLRISNTCYCIYSFIKKLNEFLLQDELIENFIWYKPVLISHKFISWTFDVTRAQKCQGKSSWIRSLESGQFMGHLHFLKILQITYNK